MKVYLSIFQFPFKIEHMVIVPNDSYGLFRASHSYNPPEYSHFRVASPHFMLISWRAINPYSHLHASMTWEMAFCTGIIYLINCSKY